MDNSVFGCSCLQGLAERSRTKASRAGLEAEGLPQRDTVVWMIERGIVPTLSRSLSPSPLSLLLQPFINEKKQQEVFLLSGFLALTDEDYHLFMSHFLLCLSKYNCSDLKGKESRPHSGQT